MSTMPVTIRSHLYELQHQTEDHRCALGPHCPSQHTHLQDPPHLRSRPTAFLHQDPELHGPILAMQAKNHNLGRGPELWKKAASEKDLQLPQLPCIETAAPHCKHLLHLTRRRTRLSGSPPSKALQHQNCRWAHTASYYLNHNRVDLCRLLGIQLPQSLERR